jgi:hypothetical protein
MSDALLRKISTFPNDTHVREVCKHGSGEAACRYLAIVGGEIKCGKYGPARDFIDRRVADNSMTAKGDNCEGIVGLLKEDSGSLTGTRIIYTESVPTLEVRGTLKGIDINPSGIVMRVEWDEGKVYDPSYDLGTVQIDLTKEGLLFSLRGAGDLAGVIAIQSGLKELGPC